MIFYVKQDSILNIYYLIGRISSVLFRPIILLLSSYFLNSNLLNEISSIYLITMLSVVISSFSTHRELYILISKEKNYNLIKKEKKNYFDTLPLIFIIGLISSLLLVYLLNFNSNIIYSILFLFLCDKIYDEYQRYLILNKKFKKWGKINIIRFIINLGSFCLCLLVLKNNSFLLFSLFNFLFFSIYLIKLPELKIKIIFEVIKNLFSNLKKVLPKILKLKRFLIASILASSLSYSDRLITSGINKNIIGEITLISMIFSILPTFINFFYIANNLKEFAKEKFNSYEILFSINFWKPVIIFIIVSWSILIFYYELFGKIQTLNYLHFFLIFLSQLLIALTLVLNSLKYWKKTNIEIIFIDVSFWFIFIIITFYNATFKENIFYAFLLLNFLLFLRFLIYFFRTAK